MTGFAKSEVSYNGQQISIELKSVNNRFKEIRFRIPHQLTSLEMKLREALNQKFKRGSFDVSINLKRSAGQIGDITFNSQKVEAYIRSVKAISDKVGVGLTVSSGDFLRSEFLNDQNDETNEELNKLILSSFSNAVSDLIQSREEEGNKLLMAINTFLKNYEESFNKVKGFAVEYKLNVENKLNTKLKEYKEKIQIDNNRLLQELVFYLEKLDVEEEFTRVESHLGKMREIIAQSSEKGRQLDFLLQELGRETNTIGSKSADSRISQHVVEMKTYLEKIREQALNLE